MPGEMTIEAAFGAVVRGRRKERGLSQEQLAFDSDLDRSFVSQVECGHKQPSIVTIFQLAKALHTTPAKLLVDTEQLLGN